MVLITYTKSEEGYTVEYLGERKGMLRLAQARPLSVVDIFYYRH